MRGIHYRNRLFYHGQTWLKLKGRHHERFKIASSLLQGRCRVVDVCAGDGFLKRFLAQGCHYTAIDASPSFTAFLKRQGIEVVQWNMHNPLPKGAAKGDAVVMIISLCHFSQPRADELLEELKSIAPYVIIVEELSGRPMPAWFKRLRDFCCDSPHYVPMQQWTVAQFTGIMRTHGYNTKQINGFYWVGTYENTG